jgi:NitT/TauT family transport system ATP-binding protein
VASMVERMPENESIESPVLTLDSVSKSFFSARGEVSALTDVSLQVRAGEIIALIGPSGCGKTTIMRMCAGFDFPTQGTALFQGGQIVDVNSGVGYLTQEADLFPWMTLRENVAFPLEMLGVGKEQRATWVAAYLELVGLSGFEDHYPHQLSGGMRQRGALARTMIYEPELILMDEPFASLDMPTRLMLHDELLRLLAERPKTVVLVTHDITEAIALADRVVIVGRRPGRIKAIIDVDLPRPRTSSGIVNTDGFAEIYNKVWTSLQSEFIDPAALEASQHSQLPPALPAPEGRRASSRRKMAQATAGSGPVAAPGSQRRPQGGPRRGWRRYLGSALAVGAARILFLAALLGLWQILSSTKVLSPLLFSAPSGVFAALYHLLANQPAFGKTIYTDLATTLDEMAIGYVIGAGLGILVGVFLARIQWLARVFEPLILAAYSVPKVALAPVFIVLLGIGTVSKVAIVAMELFFIVFFNTFIGVRDVREDFIRQAQINGAGRFSVLRRIVLPGALPSIMTGLKLGVPFAMVGAVIGEFIAASDGLGWFVVNAANNFDSQDLFAGIIVLVIVVWVLSQAMQVVERLAVPWNSGKRASRTPGP